MVTLLAKGDPVSGSMALVCRRRDGRQRWLTATSDAAGDRLWLGGRDDLSDEDIRTRLERQQRSDPDAWVLELDGEAPEQLLDEPIID